MDTLIELLKNCEVTTILALFAGFYVFNGMMNKKFDKLEAKMDSKFDKVDSELKRIDTDIKELRTSLNRMEGAFYSKECCMLNNNEQDEKAR